MKYLKQIDGLRAFAVIAVIIHHWTPETCNYSFWVHLGAYGVDLFFVISGFLITSILIKEKNNGRPVFENMKTFYLRRSLRIFPIYYIFLIFIFIYNWSGVKSYAVSLLSYFFNFDMYFNGWSKVGFIQHLWSLSVEEQFYIFWPPLVLLFINKKNAFFIISLLIAVSFMLCVVFLLFSPYKEIKLFTPYAFISLLLGAFLSFLKDKNIKIPYSSILIFLLLSLFILLKSDFIPHFPAKNIVGYLIPIPSFIFFLLINKTVDGYKGMTKVVLENNFLCSLGKISYGLYIYHMIIPYLFFKNDSFINIFYNCMILLFISVCSWNLIEKPVNNLKRRFSYKEKIEFNKKLIPDNDLDSYQSSQPAA